MFCVVSNVFAEIRLHGIISGGKKTLFALGVDDNRPDWLGIGDTVGGMKIDSYDYESDSVTLRKGPDIIVVTLPMSKVRHAANSATDGKRDASYLALKAQKELDFIYALALAGDEEVAGLVERWGAAKVAAKALSDEVDDARTAYGRNPSREKHNAVAEVQRRLSSHLDKQNQVKNELLKVAASRKKMQPPNVAVRLVDD